MRFGLFFEEDCLQLVVLYRSHSIHYKIGVYLKINACLKTYKSSFQTGICSALH